jgi:hypothetical protein
MKNPDSPHTPNPNHQTLHDHACRFSAEMDQLIAAMEDALGDFSTPELRDAYRQVIDEYKEEAASILKTTDAILARGDQS